MYDGDGKNCTGLGVEPYVQPMIRLIINQIFGEI